MDHHDGERRVINANVCQRSFDILTIFCAHHGVSKAAGLDAMLHLAQLDVAEFAQLARRIDSDRRDRYPPPVAAHSDGIVDG